MILVIKILKTKFFTIRYYVLYFVIGFHSFIQSLMQPIKTIEIN